MPTRPEVRDAQRTIASLDAAYSRAEAAHGLALNRRAEVIAEQDQLVDRARSATERAVAEMAHQLSPELTAHLLGLDLSSVRRHARNYPESETSAPTQRGRR